MAVVIPNVLYLETSGESWTESGGRQAWTPV